MRWSPLVLLCSLLELACSSFSTTALDAGRDAGGSPADQGADTVVPVDGALPADLPLPPPADQRVADGAPPPPPLLAARGVVHMHSIYSHDGCDGKGFANGQPNTECVKQLREAACGRRFDFVAMTDHPANMADYPMAETLYFDATAGDQLVLDAQGEPLANRVACPGGRHVLFSVGFEATHVMPIGLHGKPTDPASYGGISDATPIATIQSQVQALKDRGAVAAMVHSEEDDISAATIDAGGFEAMEWYNIHASFLALLGKDTLSLDLTNLPQLAALIGTLNDLSAFFSGAAGAPHPDLVYLLLLDKLPSAGFDKWRAIQRGRAITGLLGSDIHRNVSLDSSTCAGPVQQLACSAAVAAAESALGITISPVLKSLLLSGGTINMPDGDRIDSYGRLMRWLENRVLVQAIEPEQISQALRDGRSYGVFTIFGDPAFSFRAQRGSDWLEIGDAAPGPLKLDLLVSAPQALGGGVPFTPAEAGTAEVRARLVRTDGSGSTVVAEGPTGSAWQWVVNDPGAYHVEVLIRPQHLAQALGTKSALATKEYLWVITNPIRLRATP